MTTSGGSLSGVQVQGASKIDIQRVTFTGASQNGLYIADAAGSVTNSTSHHNQFNGFTVTGNSRVVLSNNNAQNNGYTGFDIYGGAAPQLTGNTSKTNGSKGFGWRDQASGVASNNTA